MDFIKKIINEQQLQDETLSSLKGGAANARGCVGSPDGFTCNGFTCDVFSPCPKYIHY